ncbi:MAG TPA: tetraacyldisaccharide 4'-kinase, partial [Bryobacteraceae bacterium]|nr:tetraacyldisaccharide 4'-kinase [Bryobacteraceae bacterium]
MALYLLYRGFRDRRYFKRLKERFGFLSGSLQPAAAGVLWFHAVSVGEVLSAAELIRRLRLQRPSAPVYVSVGTLAGRAAAEQRLSGLADGIFFAPLDYRFAVRRVLRRLRPAAVVILETEIWPNLYRESKRAGASLLLVNGRISDRALPRYRKWSWFFRHSLIWPDAILAQSEEDAKRFVAAGAPSARVRAAGNLKYDFTPPAMGLAAGLAAFLDRARAGAVWIAASTMPPQHQGDPDEDDAVIAAFKDLNRPELLLVLAPRKPERFDMAAEKLKLAGIPFARRSALTDAPAFSRALLLDSIGELSAVFEHASVVFMGGTLASRGGHNILEPAYFAKPVIAGPHMENFAAIADEFTAAGALKRIESAEELAAAVADLLNDSQRAHGIGARARDLAISKRGVADGMAREILQACDEGVPDPPRTLPARAMFAPMAGAWSLGNRLNLEQGFRSRRALPARVVSVGGLAMGGTGKSPMVEHLAARLREAGHNPAILTRGYRRKAGEQTAIVPR